MAPGVAERVYANRLAWRQVKPCASCIGLIAMMRRGDLGRKVWLEHDGQRSGPYLCVDVANPAAFGKRLAIGDLVELDWQTAQRWQMRGPVMVRVGEWQEPREGASWMSPR